ncbi:glycosyltransferase [Mangrovimonas sp. DI 80]|uniref:glycosyltransferase family 2 protein n=1 Tax=Mangrovimonas sp. DI 80 TaxID=1779330 RepID=UPI000F51423F|nr:glycosyltransferase [Mangrovimonas sp. DI 80]
MKEHLNTQPLISVVMATYNGEKFIAEAIQSILDQTYKNFEFLIVDDGSTDRTQEIIRGFRDHRIRYIKKEANTGIADSLNKGIAQAQGTYIARMDDDDVSFPHRLERQLEAFHEDPELGLCATNVELDQKEKIKTIGLSHQEIKMKLLFGNTLTHPTVMLKKELFKKYQYNSEMVPCEDYDLWTKVIWNYKCVVLKTPLLYYRYRKYSETSRRRKEQLRLCEPIAAYMFSKLEWTAIKNHDACLKIMATHEYTVNSSELNGLMKWLDALLEKNAKMKVFEENSFKTELEAQRLRFLKSYFSNRSIGKKVVPFLALELPYKMWILKYYLETYLK